MVGQMNRSSSFDLTSDSDIALTECRRLFNCEPQNNFTDEQKKKSLKDTDLLRSVTLTLRNHSIQSSRDVGHTLMSPSSSVTEQSD